MANNLLNRHIIRSLYETVIKYTTVSHDNDCVIFNGTLQGGYGIVSKTFGGHRYRLYAHRAVFLHESGLLSIPDELEMSHLCHNKQCVRYDHLIIEPHVINNNRQHCKAEGTCTRNHFDSNGQKLKDCLV